MGPSARPAIAGKARLRYDERSGGWMLLYPERGISLSGTASDILRLCDGERTVADIVATLSEKYGGAPAASVERDVLAFLGAMSDRGLVVSAT